MHIEVKHRTSLKARLVSGFMRSWWVLSFIAFCLCAHLAAVRSHNLMLSQLEALKDRRLAERNYWQQQHKLWSLRLANCQNPAWLELILMRELGVSPKDTIKIVFEESDEPAQQRATGAIS